MISQEVEQQLIAREKEVVASDASHLAILEETVADDFHEIGSSGRLYSKRDVLDVLRDVKLVEHAFGNFRLFAINSECVIVTYVATLKRTYKGNDYSDRSYRSSTWVRREGVWRLVFHQATSMPPAG